MPVSKKVAVKDNNFTNEIVDPEKIDDAVQFINEKANEMVYKGSIEIGDYILDNFFNNDIRTASSKSPIKNKSYRALCEHDALSVPVSTLSVAVRVSAQERLFNEKKMDVSKLTYTHKAELIKIKDGKTKIKLVKRFNKKPVSTREFIKTIKIERGESPTSSVPTLTLTVRKLDQITRKVKATDFIPGEEDLKKMKPTSLGKLTAKTETTIAELESALEKVKYLKKNLNMIENEQTKRPGTN